MRLYRKFLYYRFILSKSKDEFFPTFRSEQLWLFTIAFNNVEFVQLQIFMLKKYFKEDFSHCIVDNSDFPSIRHEIKAICIENGVSYVGLPKGPYSNQKSHGAAMHWAYVRLVRRIKPSIFGFLDHDIFPFRSFKLEGKLYQGVYGRVMNSYLKGGGYLGIRTDEAPFWSLWAGFCFFDFAHFKDLLPWKFNFFSKHFPGGYFLDTGGGLWDIIYSNIDYPVSLAKYRKLKWDSKVGEGDQNDSFEIIDEAWIHFVSLSNWRFIQNIDKKKEKLHEILSDLCSREF